MTTDILTDTEAIRLVDEKGAGMDAVLNSLHRAGYDAVAMAIWSDLPSGSKVKADMARAWLRSHPETLPGGQDTRVARMLREMDEMERRFRERLDAWKREILQNDE